MEIYLLCIVLLVKCVHGEYLNLTNLAKIKQGIELASIENALHTIQSSYKLEDFFWTGSGDGGGDDSNTPSDNEGDYSTTVFTTKTVYVTSTTAHTTPTTACQSCDTTTTSTTIDTTPISDYDLDADKEFWLLTVLKSDGKDPDVVELRKNLASLYRKAFLRQQAKHLGIKPRIKRHDKPINVYIHKIDKQPINGEDKIEVVYHVAVAGQPVDATTAAEDMRLVTDKEVKEELGFPFLVKAEPYIKPTVAQELAEVKPTWLFVSISLIILIILILGVILAAFCVSNKRKTNETDGNSVFNQEGQVNDGYKKDNIDGTTYKSGRRNQNPSPTYINFRSQASNETLNSIRPNSGLSSSTLSSNASIDISPLMGVGKPRKIQRPKAAVNKTVPLNVAPSNLSTSSSSSTLSDAIFVGHHHNTAGIISPKSFLSMPSVKAFPKGNNPEPLNKVLEPLSVHHLDMHDPDDFTITRHGSLGASEDPGVIGPVVWNLHKHRMQRGASLDDDIDDAGGGSTNVSKMRKRFHELLDDTFSLFGSRRESPQHKPIQVKSHSAFDRNFEIRAEPPRPKTSEPRKTAEGPKGAWMSTAPSPLVRPISAPFDRPYTAPRINRELILVNGVLRENDPAIPLIEEIKKEIDKCSSPNSKPGSSHNNN